MQKLLKKIKTKNLANIDDERIKTEINLVLKQNRKLKTTFDAGLTEKSFAFKAIVKAVKQNLHRSYGAFQTDINKRNALLEKLRKNPSDENLLIKMMLTHKSTKERINLYATLYYDLFGLTGKPKTILDLGCGLNPLSYDFMHTKAKYIASEFNDADNKFIEMFFKIKNIDGKVEKIDLEKDFAKLKKIKADVVFAFKIFDVISNTSVEKIIKSCSAKYVIASFSTETLDRKRMTSPRRAGFQKLLRRLNLKYSVKSYKNEMFYIISLGS